MIGARFDEVALWADDGTYGDPTRDRGGAVGLLVAPHSMGSGYVVLVEAAAGGDGRVEWVVGQVPVGAFAHPRILSYGSAYDDLSAAVDEFKARTVIGAHPEALMRLVAETKRAAL